MSIKAKHPFRLEVLDRLISPKQLNQMMQRVKPRSWLSLVTMGGLVSATLIWSVFGRIPLIITGQGVLIKPRQVVQFQASSAGQLISLNIKPGDSVKKGDVIGIIDQSSLQQQLQQAEAKLAELQSQNQTTNELQQLLNQELASLQQQQQDLEMILQRERESLQLSQKNQQAIAEKRISLETQKEQFNQLLITLQEQIDSRQHLYEQQIISYDMLIRSQQDYFNAQSQLANIDIQLKELDIQEAQAQQDYLERLNTIDTTETKLQSLAAQETNQREQTLKQSIDHTNQIQNLQRQIAQLTSQLADQGQIISQYDGHVLDVSIVPGQVVSAGDRLGMINVEDVQAELISYIYFIDQDGRQIQPGMSVQITPSFDKREQYGEIIGTVTEVSSFPISPEDIAATIGNPDIARTLTSDGKALIQVLAQLEEDPTTESNYRWSSSEDPPLQVSSGTTTSVRVRVGEQAPIRYVLPILRRWTGIGG